MITIREAISSDYQDVARLNHDALGYDYPADKTKERLLHILSLPTDIIFVAEDEKGLCGYIHLSGYDCTYQDSLKNILSLAVHPDYQRRGVGRTLIDRAEQWAVSSGARGLRLVSGYNREDAHRFYEAMGYTMRKEQKNYIKWF